MTGKLQEIGRLADLRDRGALTDEEFEREKAILLGAQQDLTASSPKRKDEARASGHAYQTNWFSFATISSRGEAVQLLAMASYVFYIVVARQGIFMFDALRKAGKGIPIIPDQYDNDISFLVLLGLSGVLIAVVRALRQRVIDHYGKMSAMGLIVISVLLLNGHLHYAWMGSGLEHLSGLLALACILAAIHALRAVNAMHRL